MKVMGGGVVGSTFQIKHVVQLILHFLRADQEPALSSSHIMASHKETFKKKVHRDQHHESV